MLCSLLWRWLQLLSSCTFVGLEPLVTMFGFCVCTSYKRLPDIMFGRRKKNIPFQMENVCVCFTFLKRGHLMSSSISPVYALNNLTFLWDIHSSVIILLRHQNVTWPCLHFKFLKKIRAMFLFRCVHACSWGMLFYFEWCASGSSKMPKVCQIFCVKILYIECQLCVYINVKIHIIFVLTFYSLKLPEQNLPCGADKSLPLITDDKHTLILRSAVNNNFTY